MSYQLSIALPENVAQLAPYKSTATSVSLHQLGFNSQILQLQRTLGNQRVGELVRTERRAHQVPIITSQQKSTPEVGRNKEKQALARSANPSVLQRQHPPGGPYHPPEGVSTRCTMADSCSSLSLKINYLRHTIASHQQWDIDNPMPSYPGGRHADEIRDLQNALNNCIEIAQTKCSNQPQVIRVPSWSEILNALMALGL